MNNFKELKVWQKAIALVAKVYRSSKSFPKEEIYGTTSQMRRAVCSISMDITEGSGRRTSADFSHFLN
jgi:four helix bundle protein